MIGIMLCVQQGTAQTYDVGYLNPQLGSSGTYKFMRFGNSSDYYAGFMWNEAEQSFGDGDDFTLFTYQNRDLTFKTGTGNFIVFPSGGGNVGIGTRTPGAKLQVNGDFYLYNIGDDNGDRWGETHFYWNRHSLVMGTPKGRYAHNKIEIRPGGYSGAELISYLSLYQALDENTHEERIRFTSSGSHSSWIDAGNVGIGTNNPIAKLDVNGVTKVNSLSIDSQNSVASVNGFSNRIEFTGGGSGAMVFHPGEEDELMFGMHSNGNFYWGTGRNATKPDYYGMYLNASEGNLGIKGRLAAKEVKVDVDGWSDFVFEENYELPTLEEVEKHIKEKGHLKDIPSAKDVENNGIYLGEMNAKLLQKIEELTLYIIELKEENIKQEELMKQQAMLLSELRQELSKLKE